MAIEGGLKEKLEQKKRHRGLTDPELDILEDLRERGEPDLTIYWPEDPMSRWMTKTYVNFAREVSGITLFHTQINFAGRVLDSLIHNKGETITALFSRQCAVEGTQVLCGDGGLRNIEDAVEEKTPSVASIRKTGLKFCISDVSAWIKNENPRHVWKVRTESGYEITATRNEPFLVLKGMRKESRVKTCYTTQWKNLNQLSWKGKEPDRIGVYNCAPVFGNVHLKAHEAIVLGWLWFAVGGETVHGKVLSRLKWALEKFGNEFEVKRYDIILKSGNKALEFVRNLVPDPNQIPTVVTRLDRGSLSMFLGGLFKRYAKVTIGKHISFTHHDKQFLLKLKMLLSKYGIYSCIVSGGWKLALRIPWGERHRFLYETGMRGKGLEVVEKMPATRKFVRFEKITHIEYVGEAVTYDMTVPGVANFFKGGFVNHNSGKTENCACLSFFLSTMLPALAKQKKIFKMYERGMLTGIYAPIMEQAQTMFDRLKSRSNKQFLYQIGIDVEANNGNTYSFTNGSSTMSQSASENSNIESKTWHMAIIEEAQDVLDKKVTKSISPMLAFNNGTMVKIGTVGEKQNHFWESIEKNKKTNPLNHNEYDYRHICYVHEPYYKYVLKEIEKLGWDHPSIKMSYRLIWAIEVGHFVLPGDLQALGNERLEAGMLLRSAYPKFVGIDTAKSPAQTVATLVAKIPDGTKSILDWQSYPGEKYEDQADRVAAWLAGIHNVKEVWIDSNHKEGDAVYEWFFKAIFRACPWIKVVPVKFTGQMKDHIYRILDLDIKGQRVSYPRGKRTRQGIHYKNFFKETVDLEKEYKNGLMLVHKPDKKNHFDDYPDSWALGNAAADSGGGIAISVKGSSDIRSAHQTRNFADRRDLLISRR